jgi:hypothetical protein
VDLAPMTLEILLTLVELVLLLILEAEPPETFEAAEKGIHCHRFHLFRQVLLAILDGLLRIVSTSRILLEVQNVSHL